jgi:DsbC/DsbD-like thiol-disulfide interchange protein
LRIFPILFAVFFATPALAGETPWVDHQGMLQTRIVSASADMTTGDGVMLAWEAKLAPGWKTYWRSPGEAGLPIRVFVGQNEIAPLYPYPTRFELFGIQTFGYKHQLLLPFRVKDQPDGPLDLRVDFMVCKDICVPFKFKYQFPAADLAPAYSMHDIRIDAWLKKVPDTSPGKPGGLEILGVKVAGKVGHQKIIVDVRADADLGSADLLAEVNDMFHFSMPKLRLLEDGKTARMVLSAMAGNKPQDLRGQAIRLTFSDGHGTAIDRTLQLPK